MKAIEISELKKKANQLREDIIDCAYLAGKCHLGGALSTIEVLTGLYYNVMTINPMNPRMENRDRFILSKGHGVLGLYAVLADLGYYDKDTLLTYKRMGSILQGHPNAKITPGIEMSAGSLGQGISFGVGKALALRMKGLDSKVYIMVGDGELEEGQNWEAIASAAHYQLDNVVVIIDHNKLQLDNSLEKILSYTNIEGKFEAFGWHIISIDGHNMEAIIRALKETYDNKPIAIIANTVKGKGISFMENNLSWHCNIMTNEQYLMAKHELKEARGLCL